MNDSFIVHSKVHCSKFKVFSCNFTFMEKKGHLPDEEGRQPLQVSKIIINLTACIHSPCIDINL